ncbi:MAG: DUF2924 domain-containing protein [Alteraurantiacibacter sp.]
MREPEIEALIGSIEGMDLEALRRLWRERCGAPPPLRSTPILQMMLAWRIQAEAYGGLDDETRNALGRSGPVEPEGRHLGVGARLVRNWKGRRVEVHVEEGGFRREGTLYRSLTAAATAIAGSKWNGPKFFGLREAA